MCSKPPQWSAAAQLSTDLPEAMRRSISPSALHYYIYPIKSATLRRQAWQCAAKRGGVHPVARYLRTLLANNSHFHLDLGGFSTRCIAAQYVSARQMVSHTLHRNAQSSRRNATFYVVEFLQFRPFTTHTKMINAAWRASEDKPVPSERLDLATLASSLPAPLLRANSMECAMTVPFGLASRPCSPRLPDRPALALPPQAAPT